MKIKNGYVLRDVAGVTVVLPTGDDLDLSVMISLNETAKFLWCLLETGAEQQELVEALLCEYAVDRNTAEASVSRFIAKLTECGCIE